MVTMQDINLWYLLEPIAAVLISTILVMYWYRKRRFGFIILMYSLFAYAIAITVKVVFQELTIGYLPQNLYIQGLYYGLQTAILEVGLAYIFARYLVRKRETKAIDGISYGLLLAFWENGILLGVLPIINIISAFAIIHGGTAASSTVYNSIASSNPSLLLGGIPTVSILLGILERVSSIIIHLSWGILAFAAAFYGRKKYLALALPMGLVDFFVPFSKSIGIFHFEILIFLISVASLALAYFGVPFLKRRKGSQRGALPKQHHSSAYNQNAYISENRNNK